MTIENKKCIVISSGGLDSTTVAAHAKYIDNCEVLILHFRYGCRADSNEVMAVKNISNALDVECVICDLNWLKQIGGSTLTDPNAEITGSIEGAEYPHEWVPARNLLFIAHAAAMCDAMNISDIYMGLNLEEGAVYRDNTIEFYEKFEDLLQLGALSHPRIRMPLARMMKWQIVEYAYKINAPINLSWSCYHSGQFQCGNCGPCYMRRTAHKMLEIPDTVKYVIDESQSHA